MKAAGLKEIEAAKQDGRWQQAYDSPKNMIVPGDFLKELENDSKAKTFLKRSAKQIYIQSLSGFRRRRSQKQGKSE